MTAKLARQSLFTLNLGSKATMFGDIRVDLSRDGTPDVVADALHLPFKPGIFQQVIFAEVLEHIPKMTEVRCLKEIARVMKDDGISVLSTPSSNHFLFTVLDPAFWLIKHRHYKPSDVNDFITRAGFSIEKSFFSGFVMTMLANFFYNKWLLGLLQRILEAASDNEYSKCYSRGYTIFMLAVKKS
jgi:ubiquinone/menaquinone biosynthesis C-methylase UbiE